MGQEANGSAFSLNISFLIYEIGGNITYLDWGPNVRMSHWPLCVTNAQCTCYHPLAKSSSTLLFDELPLFWDDEVRVAFQGADSQHTAAGCLEPKARQERTCSEPVTLFFGPISVFWNGNVYLITVPSPLHFGS
jgi:hypothetical protein